MTCRDVSNVIHDPGAGDGDGGTGGTGGDGGEGSNSGLR
jgi:hypothetical protein